MFIHNQEAYYQSVVYILAELSGLRVIGEGQTHTGRMDAIIESPTHIYIFEFKMTTVAGCDGTNPSEEILCPLCPFRKRSRTRGCGF